MANIQPRATVSSCPPCCPFSGQQGGQLLTVAHDTTRIKKLTNKCYYNKTHIATIKYLSYA